MPTSAHNESMNLAWTLDCPIADLASRRCISVVRPAGLRAVAGLVAEVSFEKPVLEGESPSSLEIADLDDCTTADAR
jgi:hypothetical protein